MIFMSAVSNHGWRSSERERVREKERDRQRRRHYIRNFTLFGASAMRKSVANRCEHSLPKAVVKYDAAWSPHGMVKW